MSSAPSIYEYQFGGSLDSHAPSYVTRSADSEFYQALKAGQFCYVLNSRQMGKSSLRVRTMQRLQQEGVVCVFIDLTGMGKQDVTPEKWYAGIVQSLVSGCQLNSKIEWRIWWKDRQALFSPARRLALFVEEVLLVEVQQDIVIFVDEIDRVLSQTFSLDDFFGLIRFFLEQRTVDPRYHRLSFALLGVATPRALMRDQTQTPFNIGQPIELQGFQLHEVHPLMQGFVGKVDYPEVVMKDILDWTSGQPFLTQKLCRLVACALATDSFVSVEQVVRLHLLENWEAQDEPEHLRTIRDRILRNPQRVGRSLELYRQILQQSEIPADGSAAQMELRLSGLVVERDGQLTVYNPICQTVFDLAWVDRQLTQLRPYGKAIAAWVATRGKDESCLLQGQKLQEALTWSLGKSLGDQDYQFLGASQALANRQALSALAVTEQASQLLASARQSAQQSVANRRLRWKWLPTIGLAVTIPILLLRGGGLFQGFEWDLLDQFFRWRPSEPAETRIAIVTINESDIINAGQWPIPDGLLAKTLTLIKAQKPESIGLDLYRNLPVEPGHRDLIQVFQSTPNLYGIEKVVGRRIAPPSVLQKLNQVGFADQVLDADGKVRRALLSVSLSETKVSYSLAVQMALHYLETKGVALEPLADQQMRLGNAIFHRFEGNDGGYVQTKSGGYQVLLNYRGPQKQFATYSMQQVLDRQIPPDAFRDRLVLVGTTAESLNDIFYTPYSGDLFQSPQPMAGIILHANIISQMLSSALDGRPLLRSWPDPLEWLWISLWAGVGAGMSWRLKSLGAIAVGTILASGTLLGTGFIVFLNGWWLPVVPAGLALVGVAVTLPIIANRQRDKLLFRRTLTQILDQTPSYPIAVRIAVESFKQSESKEHQLFIEQLIEQQHQYKSTEQVYGEIQSPSSPLPFSQKGRGGT